MKKKIVLLFSFVLALTLALGIFAAGCKKKGDEVTVSISKTTLEVVTGKTGTLTATASDGSEIVWTTDNAEVATVDNGKVTGVKAGTATVTATVKDGEASATCAVTVKDPVTFVFKVGDEEVTEITVDRNGDPVQLSAIASDGSEITAWNVDDEDIISVENGLVTGLREGTAKVLVTSSSRGTGEISVTVIDTIDGDHYQITTEQTEGQWYYWARTDKGQTWEVDGELRGGVVTFEYNGGNWDVDSIYLAIKDPTVTNGWRRLSMTLNSSIETVITVNGTRVDLVEGDNEISVCYQQGEGASATISFSNGEAATKPTEMKVIISDVSWAPFTPVDLEIPTFTLDEDGTITITDPNEEGVNNYEIGLFFENGSPFSVYNQSFRTTTGTLDTSAVDQNGEYIVRIRAIGNPGFTSTDWSDGNDIKWTIDNQDISYTLSTDGTHGSGASAALTSGRWEYWLVTEEGSVFDDVAEYDNGTLSFNFKRGWSWYGAQLFRHYSNFDAGTNLEVTMTINVAGGSGNITVCGEVFAIEDGVDKTITVYILQPDNAGQTEIQTTLTVSFGEAGEGQMPAEGSIAGYTALEATISDISVVPFIPETLLTPDATFTPADEENAAKIEITNDANDEEKVASYQVGFFTSADATRPAGTAAINEDGTFSDLSIEDGEYYLKVCAVAANALYANSEWSDALNEEVYVVANGGKMEEITFGGEGVSTANPDVWYHWTDSAKFTTKTLTTLTETKEQILAVTYSTTSTAWYGVQLFYKNSALTAGTVYTLTLKINSSVACDVTVNGTVYSLIAGENEITVYYKESDGKASFSMQFGKENGDNAGPVASGTFTISGVKWTEYELTALEVPSIAFDGLDYTITDTANTEEGSVAGYKITIYDANDKLVSSKTITEKTGTLDVSLLESGNYKVTVAAVGTLLYADSSESEKAEIEVVNEGGITYELPFGQAADDQWGNKGIDVDGRYHIWNDQDWAGATVTMNEKTYEDGTITLDFTCTAGGTGFAVQVLRKSNELTAGEDYTLTFNINVTVATKISINGTDKQLTAGDNEVSVTFTAPACTQPGGDCIFALSITTFASDDTASNKVVISDILYTLVVDEAE